MGSFDDWKVVYITSIAFFVAPFHESFPKSVQWTLHEVAALDFRNAEDISAYVKFLDDLAEVEVDWSTYEQAEVQRNGRVEMSVRFDDSPVLWSTMSWAYEPLDDPDNAEPLPIPVDFRTEVVGALTPAQ